MHHETLIHSAWHVLPLIGSDAVHLSWFIRQRGICSGIYPHTRSSAETPVLLVVCLQLCSVTVYVTVSLFTISLKQLNPGSSWGILVGHWLWHWLGVTKVRCQCHTARKCLSACLWLSRHRTLLTFTRCRDRMLLSADHTPWWLYELERHSLERESGQQRSKVSPCTYGEQLTHDESFSPQVGNCLTLSWLVV